MPFYVFLFACFVEVLQYFQLVETLGITNRAARIILGSTFDWADIAYSKLTGLRLEAKEKLAAVRPENLGQAARISGVNPADVAALHILLESL
jgi:hypothetical protein